MFTSQQKPFLRIILAEMRQFASLDLWLPVYWKFWVCTIPSKDCGLLHMSLPMFDSLQILPASNGSATLAGLWKRPRYWDWNGTISASEPIVALCFLQVGTRLEWARSEKGPKTSLSVRLLLGFDAPDKTKVCVSFSIGENQTRLWTLLDDPDKPPQSPESSSVPIGRVFPFCQPFGTPSISLSGLVLTRNQAIGARNGLWHLKPECCAGLSDTWKHILSYGRSGYINLEEKAV